MQTPPTLLSALDPEQVVDGKKQLPRRKLSRSTTILLVALRVYVFFAVSIVIYALVRAVRR